MNCMHLTASYYIGMDPREKLKIIQQQKRRLHERIADIDTTEVAPSPADQQQLQQLLLRKKILEDQRAKQQQFLALEEEYLQRRKQAERERELQRVRNEKRMVQLEAAMKKVVFEGIKEKVKGMNSQQLMMRGYLAPQREANSGSTSASGFKDAFEGYLLEQPPAKDKPAYDLNKLNQQRLELFQRKEEVVMRQILLKELAASDDPVEIDVLSMTRAQLQAELRARHVDLQDFMHPVRKEDVLEHYPAIQQQAQQRITDKRRDIAEERAQRDAYQRLKRQLREDVNALPFKSVEVVRRLLFDLLDELCDGYDKRHVGRSAQDQQQVARKLQEDYQELWNRNLVEELSETLLQDMLRDLTQQMRRESAQEVARLNQLAHAKTEDCFGGILGQGDVCGRVEDLSAYKFPLVFVSEEENMVSKPKNQQYMKKLDNGEENVFQTEESTVSLVNDIQLLAEEERYMKAVKSISKNQIDAKNQDAVFLYDKTLFAINRHGIRTAITNKPLYTFQKPIDGILRAIKLNKNWLIESEQAVVLVTPWNREEIGSAIGARISNPCGAISACCLYPVLTFMGSPASLLLGFQKGQLLKFNPNLNRITSRQTSITHYTPVIEHAKTGDQPPFPLQNRDFIPVQPEKATKPTDQAHEFREFFEHHSQAIVFVEFYRIDRVITVDRGLHCALWEYGKGRGAASFDPIFKFSLHCSYQIYREDQNPRYRDIYPTSDSKESPQQMYLKYLQTQSFLKLQLYNNPKKQMAYLRSPGWEGQEGEKAIWKVTYKEQKRQVNKILESYYNTAEGGISAEMGRMHQETLYLLCYRDHPIRTDLKTVKLYSWSIAEKRLGRVALELDMYKEQRVSGLAIVGGGVAMRGVEMEVAVVANSGRLLLFSLVSGQLLKNINDQLPGDRLYFKTLLPALDQGFFYAIATNALLELHLEDLNSPNDRNRLNKTIDGVKRKFFR